MAETASASFVTVDRATTGHRSHRYLRLSLAVAVVLNLAAFVPPISAGFPFNPWLGISVHFAATILFFGAFAAVFAPLIALVPTGISAAQLARITRRDDIPLGPCSPNEDCVPVESMEAVYTGVITYTVVLACVVVLSLWIRRDTLRMLWRTRADAAVAGRAWALWSTFTAPAVAVLVAVVLNLAAFEPPISAGFPFNPWLGISVHFAATILFFGAFAAVPVINVIRYLAARRRGDTRIPTRYAVVYVLVPVLIVIDLVVMVAIVKADAPGIGVLVCEAVALALFAAFWIAQTIQWWREDDPPHLLPPR
jgi:hypothetical protein